MISLRRRYKTARARIEELKNSAPADEAFVLTVCDSTTRLFMSPNRKATEFCRQSVNHEQGGTQLV